MATTKLNKHGQLWLSKYPVIALNTTYVEKKHAQYENMSFSARILMRLFPSSCNCSTK